MSSPDSGRPQVRLDRVITSIDVGRGAFAEYISGIVTNTVEVEIAGTADVEPWTETWNVSPLTASRVAEMIAAGATPQQVRAAMRPPDDVLVETTGHG